MVSPPSSPASSPASSPFSLLVREGSDGDLVAVPAPALSSPALPFFGPHSFRWHRRRRARSVSVPLPPRTAAPLCACRCSPADVPCTNDAMPGSDFCPQCALCSRVGAAPSCHCPCLHPAELVSPSAPYAWGDRTPVVFVSYCCGGESLAYACNRLREAPGSVVLAVDVHPRTVALANVSLPPGDLDRLLYAQVSTTCMPTPHLLRSLLSAVGGALPAHVVELECGLPCTTYTTRSGRDSNPHRVSGTLLPRTREGRLADLFRRELFATLQWLRRASPDLSILLEQPLGSLFWRHPEVTAFVAAVGARVVAVDHCVAAVTPADLALGSPQKPSGHLVLGYPAVPDLRCAALRCAHRLPAPLGDYHAHVIQLPGRLSGRRVPGQVRVPARYAARHPEGLHGVVFSLARRAGTLPASAMVSAPAPAPAAVADPDPSFGAPGVRLHRLTPQACVYSAVELHAIFGHVLPAARMAATLNGHLDFRMKRADGSIVCSPDITVDDVTLPGPCHVCTITQMQDVGSRRLHPSVARSRRAAARSSPSAASVSFAPPLALSAMCGGAGGLGSLLLPVSLSAAGPGVPDVDLPEEAETAGSSGSSSSSSSSSEHSPGTAPEGSDADVDAECDVGRPPVFADYPDRLYSRAGALGSTERTFAAMESLPWERRGGRLIHFDVIYPEHASRGRPLKGGVTCYLLGFDLGVQCAMIRPLKHKSDLRRAFKAIAIQQHWPTQGHVAHIVTDGEPALAAALEEAALDMGCSFEVLPAYAPNANRAGAGLVKSLRSAARAYLFEASAHPGAAIDGSFEPFALEQAVQMFNVSAIPAHPLGYSPYRLLHGVPPVFMGVAFGAPLYMHIPKDQRASHVARCEPSGPARSEVVLALGPRSQYSLLPTCLTTRKTRRTSRTLYMAPAGSPPGVFLGSSPAQVSAPMSKLDKVAAAVAHVETVVARSERVAAVARATEAMLNAHDERLLISAGSHLPRAKEYINARCRSLVGVSVATALGMHFPDTSGTVRRYTRKDLDYDIGRDYIRVSLAPDPSATPEELRFDADMSQSAHVASLALSAVSLLSSSESPEPDRAARVDALMAIVAMTDLPWGKYLNGPERDLVIAAWHAELKALVDLGAIEPLERDSPDWHEAVASPRTTPCRVLLDFKRSGQWKARCVIRGDLEDKVAVDGPGFHYFSNVARMSTVRMSALRPGRNVPRPGKVGHRLVSTCDVSNAFLQSDPFPREDRRFLKIRSPIDGSVTYWRHRIPLYGSCSAPARWETTFSTWLTTPESAGGPGFVRGDNEPSVYYHRGRDLLMVLYTDDQFVDGYREDIEWYYGLLRGRFRIKEPQWLSPGASLDHLGVQMFMTDSHLYLSMERYIQSMDVVLQRAGKLIPRRRTPISPSLEITDLRPLGHDKARFFSRALGMCSWLSSTVRLDGRYAFSRIAQYAAEPCYGAYDALIHLLDYYSTTAHLCIRQSLTEPGAWAFFSDSDLCGNAEAACMRRSQLGYVAMCGSAPISWSSKVTTVRFREYDAPAGYSWGRPVVANAGIADNHADVSSAASELYAAGTCVMDVLALSYVASEANVAFPSPFVLQVDNAAAQAFACQRRYAGRSRLRHIDARLEWVRCLRDSALVEVVHVGTHDNLADMFTKALSVRTFTAMRNRMMSFHHIPP